VVIYRFYSQGNDTGLEAKISSDQLNDPIGGSA